jgi:hypothetical protein
LFDEAFFDQHCFVGVVLLALLDLFGVFKNSEQRDFDDEKQSKHVVVIFNLHVCAVALYGCAR